MLVFLIDNLQYKSHTRNNPESSLSYRCGLPPTVTCQSLLPWQHKQSLKKRNISKANIWSNFLYLNILTVLHMQVTTVEKSILYFCIYDGFSYIVIVYRFTRFELYSDFGFLTVFGMSFGVICKIKWLKYIFQPHLMFVNHTEFTPCLWFRWQGGLPVTLGVSSLYSFLYQLTSSPSSSSSSSPSSLLSISINFLLFRPKSVFSSLLSPSIKT